jgi:hypothetical protein
MVISWYEETSLRNPPNSQPLKFKVIQGKKILEYKSIDHEIAVN